MDAIWGGALFLCGVAILMGWYVHRAPQRRTDASAVRRVGRQLSRRVGREGRVFTDGILMVNGVELPFDHLVVDPFGVLLVRSFGWGTAVHGRADDATWKVSDKKREERIPNPLLALLRQIESLRRLFSDCGVYQLPIAPLVVFADCWEPPELYLGRNTDASTPQQLGGFFTQREKKLRAVDVSAVLAVLTPLIVQKGSKIPENIKKTSDIR